MSFDDTQEVLNEKNAEFWNELCGTGLARSLGISKINSQSLEKFDRAYLDFYPYLSKYVQKEDLSGKHVLEIGLGFGTLGKLLAACGCHYSGVDIAPNPVKMMRYRLHELAVQPQATIQVGSALYLPFRSSCFDYVYSIGCLHHTGSIARAVREVHRVLRPRGRAIIMLYNRDSFRLVTLGIYQRLKAFFSKSADPRSVSEKKRSLYDVSSRGEAAPHTDFVSKTDVRRMFREFSRVKIDIRNFDDYFLLKGKIKIRRQTVLNSLGRIWGLDLYITAIK